MRKALLALLALAFSSSVFGQRVFDERGQHAQLYPTRHIWEGWARAQTFAKSSNLSYHGGPTITSARVVSIFWGPSATWGTQSNPSVLASTMTGFFANFGNTGEYNVITQYSGIQKTQLSNAYWIDNSAPPTNVTDSILQGEVQNYLDANVGGIADPSTIYEVFLPPGSYSSFGNADSCGGPNLQYCAYHSNFSYNGVDVKYSSMPYPSCSGCQWTGWGDSLNLEHFATHETREAVTDPDGTAWYDSRGFEADDKCAWSPSLFIDAGYGYQDEWSNANRSCVQKR